MALPTPDLDDRRFQDLVNDAKRMVMQRCPEWTDHNVSDPGVTLIETFAFMTDQLLFRLNRVPDRLYLKFLDLIGLQLVPPVPAEAPVTFWLSAPASAPLTIAAGTQAGTPRTETSESITFATVEDLPIVPVALTHVLTLGAGAESFLDCTEALHQAHPFGVFGERPAPGDAVYLGLSDAAPRCAVRLDFRGHLDGVGVDPLQPPLAWEAYDGRDWVPCHVGDDATGGLNRSGAITLHLPGDHQPTVVGGVRGGWLRARVTECGTDQPAYTMTPVVDGLTVATIGGTMTALHADLIQNETLGTAEGVAGQRFTVSRTPVLRAGVDAELEVSSDDGWQAWTRVDTFADSGPDDRHFLLDGATGTVAFGPALRTEDGGIRQYGAIPEAGAAIRMRRYCVGGGARGNVGPGAIRTLKSSIPFVAGVENLRRAQHGADGESIEQAKARGPILLRSRSRAVTVEDFETISIEAAPEVARVRCLPAGAEGVEPGSVKVLVAPTAAADNGRLRLGDLVPSDDTLRRVAERLDAVRLIGTRVVVEPPMYRGITVVAQLVAKPRARAEKVQAAAAEALYRFLNPLTGGPDGTGWPFGRAVHAGEVFGVLQRVDGVELVDDVRLFSANPVTGERGQPAGKVELPANSLVFSYEHQIRVTAR
ncbi:putative baseplate assembly protein [Krasilnikovia sp. M28-CT-15]|uniref:putative baseplate assembly protein n=1 Tax=Krasilnikovia sp. M28-CT-15 TaxID=3373540 RepID=UPI0038774922